MPKENQTLYGLISKKDEIIYKNDIISELKNEIKNLEWTKNNIKVFFNIFFQEKNTSFGNLKERNIKIEELYLAILTFVNSNSKYLNEQRKENIYLNYLLNFLHYLNIKNEVWSLYFFNTRIIENIDKLSKEEKDIFSFINNDNFIRQVILENSHIIDNLIDWLEDELYKEEWNILVWQIIETKKIDINNTLLLKDKYFLFNKYFEDILLNLFISKEDNISYTLNNKKLLEKQKDLMCFIEDNKEKILKEENWKIIYDFIIWISEETFNLTFSDFIEKLNITNTDLTSFSIKFKEIINKIAN